jgi:hypothetical protein
MRVMDQSSGMELEVHVISDMQQTSLPGGFQDLELGPHSALELHAIGRANAANWALEAEKTIS